MTPANPNAQPQWEYNNPAPLRVVCSHPEASLSSPTIQSPPPTRSFRAQLLETIRQPLFGELLRHRAVATFLAILALIQIATAAMRRTLAPCPFAAVTGLPCPGCGLTRATVYFTRGHWHQAFTQHLFAPVVVLVLALLCAAAISPRRQRDTLCNAVESFERRTGIVYVLVALMFAYWAIRLVAGPQAALVPLQL